MDKTPHPLAAMIKEWAKDTSRVVQVQLEDFGWMDQPNPNFDPDFEWRFADMDPKAPVVRSGLSDDALLEIRNKPWKTTTGLRRRLANAAAQEIVTRIMGLDAVTRLHDEVSGGGYSRIQVIDFMNYAIKHFLANLPSALEKDHE
jgi:hypothetical protein